MSIIVHRTFAPKWSEDYTLYGIRRQADGSWELEVRATTARGQNREHIPAKFTLDEIIEALLDDPAALADVLAAIGRHVVASRAAVVEVRV